MALGLLKVVIKAKLLLLLLLGLLKLGIRFLVQTKGKQIDVCSQIKFEQALVFIESKRQACSFRIKVGEKIVLNYKLSKSPTVRAGGRRAHIISLNSGFKLASTTNTTNIRTM